MICNTFNAAERKNPIEYILHTNSIHWSAADLCIMREAITNVDCLVLKIRWLKRLQFLWSFLACFRAPIAMFSDRFNRTLIPFQLEIEKRLYSKIFTTNLQSYHSLVNPSSQQKRREKMPVKDEQMATTTK